MVALRGNLIDGEVSRTRAKTAGTIARDTAAAPTKTLPAVPTSAARTTTTASQQQADARHAGARVGARRPGAKTSTPIAQAKAAPDELASGAKAPARSAKKTSKDIADQYAGLPADSKAAYLDSLTPAQRTKLKADQARLEDRVASSQQPVPATAKAATTARERALQRVEPDAARSAASERAAVRTSNAEAERKLRAEYWADHRVFVDAAGDHGPKDQTYRATYNATTGVLNLVRLDEPAKHADGSDVHRDTEIELRQDRTTRTTRTDRVEVADNNRRTERTTVEHDAQGAETAGSFRLDSVTGIAGPLSTTISGTQQWRTEGDRRIATGQVTSKDVVARGRAGLTSHETTRAQFDAAGTKVRETIDASSTVGARETTEHSVIDIRNEVAVRVDSTQTLVVTGTDPVSGFATRFEQTQKSLAGDGTRPVFDADGTFADGVIPQIDLVRTESSTDPKGGFTTDDHSDTVWSYHASSDASGKLQWDPIKLTQTRFGASGKQEQSKVFQVAGLDASGNPIPLQDESDSGFARSQVSPELQDVIAEDGSFTGNVDSDSDLRRYNDARKQYDLARWAPQESWAQDKAFAAIPADMHDVIDEQGNYIPFGGAEGKSPIELGQAAFHDSQNGHIDRVERFQAARELWEAAHQAASDEARVREEQGVDQRDAGTVFHDAWQSWGRAAATVANVGVAIAGGIAVSSGVMAPVGAALLIGSVAGARALVENDAVTTHRKGADGERVLWALADGIGMMGGIAAIRLTSLAVAAPTVGKVGTWSAAIAPQLGGSAVATGILAKRYVDGRPIRDIDLAAYLFGFVAMGAGSRALINGATP